MDLEAARHFALSLPDTTEAPHFEMSSFRVGGKIFATVPTDGEHLHVFVDQQETRAWVSEDPAAFEELWWGKQLAGVRVNLPAAEAGSVYEMLEDSWRRKAPRRAVEARDTHKPRPAAQPT